MPSDVRPLKSTLSVPTWVAFESRSFNHKNNGQLFWTPLHVTPQVITLYYLFPLYLSHFLTDLNATCTIVYPMQALQVQEYFELSNYLKLLQSVFCTAVRNFITHNQIVIFLQILRKD